MNLRAPSGGRLPWILLLGLFAAWPLRGAAVSADAIPHLVTQNGRHALIVDGAPFLMLGGQCHNSSAWPATLPGVWAEIERMHANTLEAPVYWEQFEPEPGQFDYTNVDLLLTQARERHVRLVLLWFGTWKNGSSHYLPLWMKADPEKYPRIIGKNGERVDSPSPHAPELLAADVRAFRALMKHLKSADPQHTVLMVQVENEPGSWGSVRDYSPRAEQLFAGPVPAELLAKLGLAAHAGEGWARVFGADADEYFQAWSVAHFIGQVAAAGKAEYPLPLYVNVALRDPLSPPPATNYESGGATDNVLDLWKVAAPAIDVLAPDIYLPDAPRHLKVLELYGRADNPLLVPETIGSPAVSRFAVEAFARGAIGWAPFGIDRGERWNPPSAGEPLPDPVPAMYAAIGSSMREIARLGYEGKLHAAVEESGAAAKTVALGGWEAAVKFGPPAFGFGREPKPNSEPVGRVLIGELAPDEFLVTGYLARIDFTPVGAAAGARRDFLRVEEGTFDGGQFHPVRIWNGDETDWGLNFGARPVVLRVQLGTY